MTRGSTELFDCSRVSDYLESYLSGQVPPPERRGMRLHIHGCAACLRVVLERDPLQFFAPLADQERAGQADQGGNAWGGFYDAIRVGIAAAETERRRRARQRIRLSAAAAVLAVVTVGLVASYLAVNRARQLIVASDTKPLPVTRASLTPSGPLPQTVERVRGTDGGEVQIYTMNYYQDAPADPPEDRGADDMHGMHGMHRQTAELVLIVDDGLEL